MNQEYIAQKEIEFIIDNDSMNSTYKLALCKGAIEISYNHAEKAFLSGDSPKIIFPLSYITAYFIRYYYPIFDSPSLIPQLKTESHKNNSSSQSAFRKEFAPVLEYYSEHGGFGTLWDQMQKDTIPPQIKGEWNTLCHKVNATIVNQPMKHFGNKHSHQMHSIFEPIPDFLADDYFEDFPGCSVSNDFFSYPLEYHNIFKNVSYSRLFIEKIHQRWSSFTLPLLDEKSDISSSQMMNILLHSTNDQTATLSEQKCPAVSDWQPLQIIPIILNSLQEEKTDIECDIFSYSAENIVNSLHEIINESHADFIAVTSEREDAESELSEIDSEIVNAEITVQKIMNQYGMVNESVPTAIATLEKEKSNARTELNSAETSIRQRRDELICKINDLKSEKKELEHISDSITYESAEFAKQKAEIIQLFKEYETLERYLKGRPPAFGYVGEPIKRFLTHCDDIASEFLLQSIQLYLAETEPFSGTNSALPEWFISAFENWRKDKNATLQRERRTGGTRTYNPELVFDSNHREITLIIPAQDIQSKRPLDEVVFIVHTSSEILSEETYPLYHENGGYASEEIRIPITEPSDVYHVELVCEGASKRFPAVELFPSQKKYACFDYKTGRLIAGNINTLEKSAYVIFSEPIIVTPESAIIESGRFYGLWDGYSYYFVDPQYSDTDTVSIGAANEDNREINHICPSVTLKHYHYLENIRINGKTTLSGLPPTILLSLPLPEELPEYRLSIHPLCPGTIAETTLYSYDDFKDHCSFSDRGRVCRFDLSSDYYLGIHPIGTFAIRIRNQKKTFDHIFEFSIIPALSVSLSKHLYLPEKGNEMVVLSMRGPAELQCFADEPFVATKGISSWAISGPIMQEVHGSMSLAIPGKAPFSGTFSLSVPHLSWRFENPETGTICPIQRKAITVSDDAYDELGDGKKLTLFLPEGYSGTGTVTITPGNSYIMQRIKTGKAIFSLSRFNDILRETHARNYSFVFSFESKNENFETTLFNLDIWKISGFDWEITMDDDTREITFFWEEEGNVPNRKMIIWKAGVGDGAPQKMTEVEISAGARTASLSGARYKISSGVYYAQFIRIRDEWSSPPVHFPGEQTPNFFQFSVELEGSDLLAEGDELLAAGQYMDAIERYKELEQLNSQLGGLWKQKIQNTFMYTFRYDEALNLFSDLLRNANFLKQTDYSYITFRVFECLKRPDKMTNETFIHLFVVVERLVDVKDKTSNLIILNHLSDFKKAVVSCPALEEEQIARVLKMTQWVRSCVS